MPQMRSLLCLLVGLVVCAPSLAQEKSPDADAIKKDMDKLRDEMTQAFNKGEYEAMLKQHCHENVIATWQDGTTSQGHKEVLAHFAEIKKWVKKMTVDPVTDKRIILNDGKLVVASGNLKDKYVVSGKDIELSSRWEATIIKEGDRWVVVAFTATTDAFDNQGIDITKRRLMLYAGGGAGGAGLLIGIIAGVIFARRRAS